MTEDEFLLGGPTFKRDENPLWHDAAVWTEADIPKRRWLARGYLLRGSVTLLAGAGGASKSSLLVSMSCALALGERFGAFQPEAPCRVLTFNAEDDSHEQNRRFSAALRGFGRTPADIAGKILRAGSSGVGTLLSRDPDSRELTFTQVMEKLQVLVEEFRPDALFLDPFAELHDVDENSNTDVRAVAATFRAFAAKHDLAICLVHHSRKGAATPGDADSARGASSLLGAVRVALTLQGMTEDEAQSFGLAPEKRRHFCRLDGAKSNYASLTGCEWFQRLPCILENGETAAALEPWSPPVDAITQQTLEAVEAAIAQGTPAGPYSPKLSSDARSIKSLLTRNGIATKQGQRQALEALQSAGYGAAPFRRGNRSSAQGLRAPDGRPTNVTWLDDLSTETDEFAEE